MESPYANSRYYELRAYRTQTPWAILYRVGQAECHPGAPPITE